MLYGSIAERLTLESDRRHKFHYSHYLDVICVFCLMSINSFCLDPSPQLHSAVNCEHNLFIDYIICASPGQHTQFPKVTLCVSPLLFAKHG